MKMLFIPNEYSQQRQTQKPAWIYPVHLAMEAQWYREHGHEVYWDTELSDYDIIVTEPGEIPFLELPIPDRKWSNAFAVKYQRYGNYKYNPATHMMAANGCWHGKCTFCVENNNKYEVRELWRVNHEIWDCYRLGFKEIFDDSGTFPTGSWLKQFCKYWSGMKKMVFGCNMRIGANVDYSEMKQAGFRMLLYGVESANQYTLDRINKGIKADEIIKTFKEASGAGLEPHIAVMFGYPWEMYEDELETLNLVHFLLRKGYAKTAQASIYRLSGEQGMDTGSVQKIYDVAALPEFWINKIKDIKNWNDVKYLFKGIRKGIFKD